MNSLKETLSDWIDADGAEYHLAVCLGLMMPGDFARAKHVFWSNNPIGNILYQMLDELARQAVLEKRDEPDYQFRWNTNFKGSWE